MPLGFPAYYRGVLFVAYEGVLFGTLAWGYMHFGPGWLLLGLPFAWAAGVAVDGFILCVFPPTLVPHAEGNTWLKLT